VRHGGFRASRGSVRHGDVWLKFPEGHFISAVYWRKLLLTKMKKQDEFIPGQYYHVIMKANHQDVLFKDSLDKSAFLHRICRFILPCAEVISYVLLSNHVHLLIRPHPEAILRKLPLQLHEISHGLTATQLEEYLLGKVEISLSKFLSPHQGHLNDLLVSCIRGLKISYKCWYNNRYQASGTLWARSRVTLMLPNSEDIYRTIAYIHHNPVHHGLVKEPGDWQFSSYTEIIWSKSEVIRPTEVLKLYSSLEDFIELHQEAKPIFAKKTKNNLR
jgi:putative transposase